MTALMSLATRLALAKVALVLPGAPMEVEDLGDVIDAGVDLLILGGDTDADVELVRDLRRWGTRPLLVGTSSGRVAAPAAADVVHLARPGWRFWGYPRGHEWSLLGRDAREVSVVRDPGADFDYFFVEGRADSTLLLDAVEHQPPLTPAAVPWFAVVSTPVLDCLASGARRVALAASSPTEAVEKVAAAAAAVAAAWDGDERAAAYRAAAFRR